MSVAYFNDNLCFVEIAIFSQKKSTAAAVLFNEVCRSAREVRCAREVDLRSAKCLRAGVARFTSLCGDAAKLHGKQSEPLPLRCGANFTFRCNPCGAAGRF